MNDLLHASAIAFCVSRVPTQPDVLHFNEILTPPHLLFLCGFPITVTLALVMRLEHSKLITNLILACVPYVILLQLVCSVMLEFPVVLPELISRVLSIEFLPFINWIFIATLLGKPLDAFYPEPSGT